MSDFLQIMAASSAQRAAAAEQIMSADLDKPLVPLTLNGFDVIAEIKERSPAEGDLASRRNQSYGRGRSSTRRAVPLAISVLTEPSRFSGSLDHLQEIVAAVPETPVMRKDFLVEPVQILEARTIGSEWCIAYRHHADRRQTQGHARLRG